jgi:hypothetical protein
VAIFWKLTVGRQWRIASRKLRTAKNGINPRDTVNGSGSSAYHFFVVAAKKARSHATVRDKESQITNTSYQNRKLMKLHGVYAPERPA